MDQRPGSDDPQARLTPEQTAAPEAENGLRQYDWAARFIRDNLGKPFAMAPGLLLELNRIAIRGLEPEAGKFRTIEVSITNTPHQPPPCADVPS